ncbi:hypothetical protein PMG11_00565 [Penicillium brasilianum]|uniref:GST N-terminal domain-containing protein n=1 Tax=Penicillium brasilianum TaxID=104259 RepID=A0A0F7TCW0_PENBI|nr:hypothetical protein PMG11_00565 [Penicillium brasilianum]
MDDNQSILYHNAYSIYALMVRYTLALGGPPKDDASTLYVREVPVDLFKGEHLTEKFLCDISKYGQVSSSHPPQQDGHAELIIIKIPVLDRYPNLIPESHGEIITSLLKKLHEVNYFSLSYTDFGGARVAAGLAEAVENLLQDPNISDRYRKALEFKRGVVKSFKVEGMEPETIKEMEHRAEVILGRLGDALPENSHDPFDGPWLFGLQEPAALDAHAIVFIERMRDVGRIGLVPEKLDVYSQKATEQDNWKSVMNGRRTMAPRPKG